MEDVPTPIAELEQGPSKFDEFMERNQKKLMILAGLIFVGVLVYVLMTGIKKKNAAEAGAAFMEATDEEAYQKVITDYSSSQTAGSAAMAIAQLRTTDEDRTKALNHYVDNYPEHAGVPAKLLELALIQMNAGKNSDAEITLQKLIANENSSYLAPRAKIALADIVAATDIEKAQKIYKEVEESQNSFFSEVATQRLLYLTAKDPVLVTKAPAAPVTPATDLALPSGAEETPVSPTPAAAPAAPAE